MKKLIAPALLLFVLPIVGQAQSSSKNKQWERPPASMKPAGYWVAVSNVKTPRANTIYFYNSNNELVGSQQLNGKKLKVEKNSTQQLLNEMLDKVLDNWTPQQSAAKDKKAVSDSTRS